MNPKTLKHSELRVVIMSPEPWEECIAQVETSEEVLFILSDEARTGHCMIEFRAESEDRILRRISLVEFRALLDAAEYGLTRRNLSLEQPRPPVDSA